LLVLIIRKSSENRARPDGTIYTESHLWPTLESCTSGKSSIRTWRLYTRIADALF